jgi:hypothetical protein
VGAFVVVNMPSGALSQARTKAMKKYEEYRKLQYSEDEKHMAIALFGMGWNARSERLKKTILDIKNGGAIEAIRNLIHRKTTMINDKGKKVWSIDYNVAANLIKQYGGTKNYDHNRVRSVQDKYPSNETSHPSEN